MKRRLRGWLWLVRIFRKFLCNGHVITGCFDSDKSLIFNEILCDGHVISEINTGSWIYLWNSAKFYWLMNFLTSVPLRVRKYKRLGNSDTSICTSSLWQEFHKSVKSNASFAKSPTHTVRTQSNHFMLSILAYVKLEWLNKRYGKNHFAMKSKI